MQIAWSPRAVLASVIRHLLLPLITNDAKYRFPLPGMRGKLDQASTLDVICCGYQQHNAGGSRSVLQVVKHVQNLTLSRHWNLAARSLLAWPP